MTMVNDKTPITTSTQFQEILNYLQDKTLKLQTAVEGQLPSLPEHVDPKLELDKARQNVLKLNNAYEFLKTERKELLGLELASPSTRGAINEVAGCREKLGEVYFTIDSMMGRVKKVASLLKDSPQVARLEPFVNALQDTLRECAVTMLNMPELGMTFAEYASLTSAERSSIRGHGRPPAPIEAKIMAAQAEVDEAMKDVRRLSEGRIKTLAAAIEGVTLTKRGRPQVSEIGKLVRERNTVAQELEDLMLNGNTEDRLTAQKIRNRQNTLAELDALIEQKESSLTPFERLLRNLEAVRMAHRDLVVAELKAVGQEQANLLMQIIENEVEQLEWIDKIREINPTFNIAVTHKVNPGPNRARLRRLEENGQLDAQKRKHLQEMQERLESYDYYRQR
ncbi:hypothetical protein ACYPKM_02995 [Pseudomonas aeruginosa]